MSTSVQPPGVAGKFYPADPAQLAAGVDASLAKAVPSSTVPKAVIAPHAGHVYSGDVAGTAYKLFARRKGEIKRVVLLGPNHRMPVRGIALSPADSWQTPLGPIKVDQTARNLIARQADVTVTSEPFAGEHSVEVHLPFVHRALGDVEIVPVLVGQAPPKQVSDVLGLLWGGPETAIVVSSDLSHFHDYETCQKKDAETSRGIESLQSAVCRGDRACGHFAIAGLLDHAQRRDLRVTALDIRNSGDTHGPRDRVVGYGSFAFEYAHTAQLGEPARRMIMDVARKVVKQATQDGGKRSRLNVNGQLPRALLAQRACFVTLKIGDQLRGCRGSLRPSRTLAADVADHAWRSAFDDPRFSPLKADEVERLSYHVSILSTARRIPCVSEDELVRAIRPDVDGIILRDGDKRGVLLPSVWEQIHDPKIFIRQLKLKAGLAANHWSPTLEAFRFVTESFGDEP